MKEALTKDLEDQLKKKAQPATSVQADRYNSGKPQLSYPLSARFALEGVAQVMEFGAKKYARDNWKKGLPLEATLDSLLRHLTKLLDGETIDEESGCHHLDLLATNALFAAYHHNGRKLEHETKLNQNNKLVPDWNSNQLTINFGAGVSPSPLRGNLDYPLKQSI